MTPSLEGLPNEVIDSIVALSDLGDICSLRLCSRTLATKATQVHFKSYFLSRHVDITDNSLREFVHLTQPGWLGCLIQHLVLVGVVNDTEGLEDEIRELRERWCCEEEYDDRDWTTKVEQDLKQREIEFQQMTKAKQNLDILKQRQIEFRQMHVSGTDVSLINEAFRNIAANGRIGRLFSLSLEVVVYSVDGEQRFRPPVRGDWGPIWKSTTQTFHTAIRSLAVSQLPIEKLNIFNDRRLQCCSLACSELGRIDFEHKGLSISLASLKSLSVSFSDTVIYWSRQSAGLLYDPTEELDWEIDTNAKDCDDSEASDSDDSEASDRDDSITDAEDEHKFMGLAKLLQLSSQLEDLELHKCDLREKTLTLRERLFQHIAEIHTPPKLKRLELRGLVVEEQDLLVFIQRTGIGELSMYNTTLSSGTFRSIFDYCTGNGSGMERLYFKDLFEQGLRVYFQGPKYDLAEPGFSFDPYSFGTPLERRGANVQLRISYESGPTRIEDSDHSDAFIRTDAFLRWQRALKKEYGPLIWWETYWT